MAKPHISSTSKWKLHWKFLNFSLDLLLHHNLKLFCFLGFNTNLFNRKMNRRFQMYWKNMGMETMWKIYAIVESGPKFADLTRTHRFWWTWPNSIFLAQIKYGPTNGPPVFLWANLTWPVTRPFFKLFFSLKNIKKLHGKVC